MDAALWIRALLAFLVVLGLIGLFALALRRFGGKLTLRRAGEHARLSVTEACGVMPGWRLVLVRRDAAEHLLLLGPESALVVESGIRKESDDA